MKPINPRAAQIANLRQKAIMYYNDAVARNRTPLTRGEFIYWFLATIGMVPKSEIAQHLRVSPNNVTTILNRVDKKLSTFQSLQDSE